MINTKQICKNINLPLNKYKINKLLKIYERILFHNITRLNFDFFLSMIII